MQRNRPPTQPHDDSHLRCNDSRFGFDVCWTVPQSSELGDGLLDSVVQCPAHAIVRGRDVCSKIPQIVHNLDRGVDALPYLFAQPRRR